MSRLLALLVACVLLGASGPRPGPPTLRGLEGNLQVATAAGAAVPLLDDDGFWSQPELKGNGDLVALVLADYIFIAHEGDAQAVAELRAYLADPDPDSPPVRDRLLVRRNGKWKVLAP
ncbi:hypothetical protein QO010_001427 [Caulobacter ginsengisoli]|uniref:DUF4440 domain-containing protein n=1 Tax=Caulobacter ginsengisoli TaxID=400775 RepID=A0ABU0INT6_9CAUL|nr:hypothetical protein [Caulobacter ginsengisoli]MDQ0463656.1 hypothetical protein [Caulobacter ginsengisoli]